jgi:hypothetical protein
MPNAACLLDFLGGVGIDVQLILRGLVPVDDATKDRERDDKPKEFRFHGAAKPSRYD